jgi:hypothetical protein
MTKKIRLSKNMTMAEFNNGYWYIDEIKDFAKKLGIANSSRLRKDQLEKIIREFIHTGKISPAPSKTSSAGAKDFEFGLTLALKIINYTSNKETKQFIENEALKIRPDLKKKPGARYRLNRWREEQLNQGNKITYADLVNEYIRLNEDEVPFKKIPHGRYINFVAEYLKNEPNATREKAIEEWKKLKNLAVPKDYKSWKSNKHKSK